MIIPNFVVVTLQLVVSIPIRISLSYFTLLKVNGLENIVSLDKSNGVIIASNHNSQLDSLAIPCALPLFSALNPVYFVALDNKYYGRFALGRFFYGGFLFKLVGAFSIEKGLHDYAASLAKHIRLLKQGRTVSIYPEGKVVPGKKFGEAHGGVAYLASVTGAPIVPVGIKGDEDIKWHEFLLFRRKLTLTFGKPIYFQEIDNPALPPETRYHSAAQKVMTRIATGLYPRPVAGLIKEG